MTSKSGPNLDNRKLMRDPRLDFQIWINFFNKKFKFLVCVCVISYGWIEICFFELRKGKYVFFLLKFKLMFILLNSSYMLVYFTCWAFWTVSFFMIQIQVFGIINTRFVDIIWSSSWLWWAYSLSEDFIYLTIISVVRRLWFLSRLSLCRLEAS